MEEQKQGNYSQGYCPFGFRLPRQGTSADRDKEEEPSSQPSPAAKAPAPKTKTAPKAKAAAPKAKAKAPVKEPVKKRAPAKTAPKANKRQKVASSGSDLSDAPSSFEDEISEEDSPKPTKKKAAQSKASAVDSDVEENKPALSEDEPESKPRQDTTLQTKMTEDSESELSDVLDEPPPKKKRQSGASATTKAKAKPKAGKATKASTATAKEVSPDEAEIKRLQGWLVKCGIRKLWYKELAKYETPKAKVKHLKDMLKDAGMDGRYSIEKANSIKEARELAADLEAVQEGAKKWGHGDGSGEEDEEDEESVAAAPLPKRRAAAATRFVDFGDSGEESDE